MRTEASDCGISTLACYSAPLGLVWFVDVLSPGRCPVLPHSAPLARAKEKVCGCPVFCNTRWFGGARMASARTPVIYSDLEALSHNVSFISFNEVQPMRHGRFENIGEHHHDQTHNRRERDAVPDQGSQDFAFASD